jgi:hypothetical protein
MKKHLALIVVALAVTIGAAAAQTPIPAPAPTATPTAPPAPPVAPAPPAAPEFAVPTLPPPPAPRAWSTTATPTAWQPALPPPTPAPPVWAATATPAASQPAPPPPPAPAAPQATQPPTPPSPPAASPQKPPAPPRAPRTPEPGRAPDAPAPGEPSREELPGRERIEADRVNIRFEVTIGYQAGTAAPVKRSAVITAANNSGSGFSFASLRSGNNVPVPTTALTTKAEDGKETPAARPLTSYNYRSVGLNVDVEQAALVPGNRVRATLKIEFSGVDDKANSNSGAPSFPTFSQRMSLYLDNGKPIIAAQSSDFVDNVERKQTVEVKATILR